MKVCTSLSLLFIFLVCPLLSQQAIDFELKDLGGHLIRLSDWYEDHVVLINFWATWCLPCRQEMLHLQKIYDLYKEQGFVVLSINIDGPETSALVKGFVNKYGFTFPVLLDVESKAVSLYNPRLLLPYSLIISRGGEICFAHQGYSPGDEDVLAEKIGEQIVRKGREKERFFSASFSEAFLFRTFTDRDYVKLYREDRAFQILNQLDLTLSRKRFIFGVRADSLLNFVPLQTDFSLAKRYFEFQTGDFSIRFGDFYHTFGRGLVFNLLKRFEAEGLEHVIDTTVDGAKLQFRRGRLSLDVLGGWIKRPENEAGGGEIKDKAVGGMIGWRAGSLGEFRLHGLYSRLGERPTFGNKDVFLESLSLDFPSIFRKLKLYGEFSLIQKKRFNEQSFSNGYGLYVEAGVYSDPFSFLLEFKDYKNMDFEYNRPPLLESEDLDILANQFDDSALDVTGFAGRFDYFWKRADILIYGKFSFFDHSPGEQPRLGGVEKKIKHLYGGAEKRFKETGYINVLAGYRDEEGTAPYLSTTTGETLHYQINCMYPLTSRLSFEADWKSKNFKGEFSSYDEWRAYVSLHWSMKWILTFFYDWTTDPETLAFKNKKNWLAAQLEIKLSPSSFFRIFAGSSKGTMKCSGGVCAFFPPFEGMRVEAVFQF